MKSQGLRLTLLAGGVGAAKFVEGLARVLDSRRLTIISNTGDDIERHGLQISPDVDIMLYTLAGIVDPAKGWGIRGDTFEALGRLKSIGEETWFQLGDRDLATHILRTSLRKDGWMATRITQYLARNLDVCSRILPMTDGTVFTEVQTSAGWMHFQEFFVKHRCEPEVLDVAFGRGAPPGEPTPEVLDALGTADAIVICPSNPVASIGPILSLRGIREELSRSRVPRIAVSPLVGGKSLKGPSDRMMRAKGFRSDALGVARFYAGLIDGIILDSADADLEKSIAAEGVSVLVTDTLMTSIEHKTALAKQTLEWIESLHDKYQHRRSRQKSVRC